VADLTDMEELLSEISNAVIPPFLMGPIHRIRATIFSFIAGVMPPMPILGRSLL